MYRLQIKKRNGFFLFSLAVFIVGVSMYIFFVGYKLTQTARTIFSSGSSSQQITLRKTFTDLASKGDPEILNGYDDGRINVLLLGIAGETTLKKGQLLTDTVMLASIDTQNHRVALMSLPRDLLVETSGGINKLNAFYGIGKRNYAGVSEVSDVVETITGQDVHYHLVMDFAGFIKIVDALEGINIDVPRTIDDPLYPGPNYGFDPFYIEKGFQKLDGDTALRYVRTRHDDPESDFGRAKRQQAVLRAIRNKALSLGTLTNPFVLTDLLQTVSVHTKTNLSPREVSAFSELIKHIDTQNITTVVVDAWKDDSLLRSTRINTPVGFISGLIPRNRDWDEINEYADEIFSLENITLRRDAIVAEDAKIHIVNASSEEKTTKRVASILEGLQIQVKETSKAQKSEANSHSFIIDLTKSAKPFTLNELTKQITPTHIETVTEQLQKYIYTGKLLAKTESEDLDQDEEEIATPPDTKETYDFLVILGENLVTKYNYEDATRESVESDQKTLPQKSL